jgi:hypothetical protein
VFEQRILWKADVFPQRLLRIRLGNKNSTFAFGFRLENSHNKLRRDRTDPQKNTSSISNLAFILLNAPTIDTGVSILANRSHTASLDGSCFNGGSLRNPLARLPKPSLMSSGYIQARADRLRLCARWTAIWNRQVFLPKLDAPDGYCIMLMENIF